MEHFGNFMEEKKAAPDNGCTGWWITLAIQIPPSIAILKGPNQAKGFDLESMIRCIQQY